jgi:hypothetical protein
MNKNLLIALSLLFFTNISYSQNIKEKLKVLENKTIQTEVMYTSLDSVFKEFRRQTLSLRHGKKDFEAVFTINQIKRKFLITKTEAYEDDTLQTEEEGPLVDTDFPIPLNEDDKGMIDNLLTFVNQPRTTYFNSETNIFEELKRKSRTNIPAKWNTGLPNLNAIHQLSGIFLNTINEKKSWIDTLNATQLKGKFVNSYEKDSKNLKKINVKGLFVPDKEQKLTKEEEENSASEELIAQETIKLFKYEGIIMVEENSFINSINLKVEKEIDISIKKINYFMSDKSKNLIKWTNTLN